MLEPHHRYCLCDECVKSMALARKYPPPLSWWDVFGSTIALAAVVLLVWLFS
jgi:hypothetical protein